MSVKSTKNEHNLSKQTGKKTFGIVIALWWTIDSVIWNQRINELCQSKT